MLRALCPNCKRKESVTAEHRFMSHDRAGVRCPASGQAAPGEVFEVTQARITPPPSKPAQEPRPAWDPNELMRDIFGYTFAERYPWFLEGISENEWRTRRAELRARQNRERVAASSSYGTSGNSIHTVTGGLPSLGRRN